MRTTAFGDLFKFIRNGMNIRQDKSGNGLPITRIETIWAGTIDASRVGFAGLKLEDCGQWMLEPGDILFSHINSAELVGKCAVYRGVPEQLVHGMNLLCLRPKTSHLDSNYAQWLIRSAGFRARLSNFINKAVNQASVSIGNLSTIPVSVPLLEEQRRIAAILDKADALRQKRRLALEKLRSFAQALFHHMFAPKLGQCLTKLADVVKSGTIITYGIVQAGEEFLGGVPYIRTGDIVDGEIIETGLRHTDPSIAARFGRSKVDTGDLVMSIRATVGTIAMVPASLRGANLTQGTARISPGSNVTGIYLLEYLRSPSVQRWIERQVKGATFREITLGRLRELPVMVPPMRTQQLFSSQVRKVASMIDAGSKSKEILDEIARSLQLTAFKGQL